VQSSTATCLSLSSPWSTCPQPFIALTTTFSTKGSRSASLSVILRPVLPDEQGTRECARRDSARSTQKIVRFGVPQESLGPRYTAGLIDLIKGYGLHRHLYSRMPTTRRYGAFVALGLSTGSNPEPSSIHYCVALGLSTNSNPEPSAIHCCVGEKNVFGAAGIHPRSR